MFLYNYCTSIIAKVELFNKCVVNGYVTMVVCENDVITVTDN